MIPPIRLLLHDASNLHNDGNLLSDFFYELSGKRLVIDSLIHRLRENDTSLHHITALGARHNAYDIVQEYDILLWVPTPQEIINQHNPHDTGKNWYERLGITTPKKIMTLTRPFFDGLVHFQMESLGITVHSFCDAYLEYKCNGTYHKELTEMIAELTENKKE